MTAKIKRELSEWIIGLGTDFHTFKIEIGNKSGSSQIGSCEAGEVDKDLASHILEVARDAGWNTAEMRKIRIYAIDGNNKTRTFQRTLPESHGNDKTPIQSDIGAVMKSLERGLDKTLNTVIEMAQIHSSSLSTLSEVINHREHVSMALLEGFIDLSQDHADSQAANTILEAMTGDGDENGYQKTATDLLSGLIAHVTGGGNTESSLPPSAEQIKEWMESDPWFADSIRSLFQQGEKNE